MATTKIRGNTQIMDLSIDLGRLQEGFLSTSTGDWDITNGAQDALITGIKLQPVNDSDVSSKWYVDQQNLLGVEWKLSCQFATSTGGVGTYSATGGAGGTGAFTSVNLTATGPFDFGGHTVLVNDRVLVKNQADAKQNGIYIVTSTGATGGLERSEDQDGTPSAEVSIGNATYLENVTSGNTGTHWVVVKPIGYDGSGVLTLNVDNIDWAQFSGVGTYIAGDGIDISGTTISVDVTDIIDTAYGLTENGNDIRVNLDAAGALSFDTGAIQVNVDDSSIEINISNQLQVKADGIKDTMIDWGTSTGQVSGGDIPIIDAGGYFAFDDVESALQQLGSTMAASYAFGTFVPTAGTSIVAEVGADTATLTASDGAIAITGTALTDTLDFTITSTGIKDYMIAWGTSTGQVSAGDVPVLDTANYFAVDDVESALAELAAATPGIGFTEVFGELPTLNTGAETATLLFTPISGTELVYLNGVRQIRGVSYDYTIGTNVLTFNTPGLQPNDIVVVDYRHL